MRRKIFLRFLILSSILSQGIGTLSEDNLKKSSDRLFRKKRLVDNTLNGRQSMSIEQFPYIANIERNGIYLCSAAILWAHIIITAAHCLKLRGGKYVIRTGSAQLKHGALHNISRILLHPDLHMASSRSDIALLIIYPPIDFQNSLSRAIPLATENEAAGSIVTISGWGSIRELWNVFPRNLRSINVPIISVDACRAWFFGDSNISEKVVCTLDPYDQVRRGAGDSGSPVVNKDGHLVAISSYTGDVKHYHLPDVSINIVYPLYRNWIIENLEQSKTVYNIHTYPHYTIHNKT